MRRVKFIGFGLLSIAVVGCADARTTPAPEPVDPLDSRLLSHVPENALVVTRLDAAALRRSSAWEAASARSPDEARGWFEATDRVVIAIGPMMPAGGMLDSLASGAEPEIEIPPEPVFNEDAPAEAEAEAEAEAGAGSLSPAGVPVSSRDLEGYREWFGDSVPAFAILATTAEGRSPSICSMARAAVTTRPRRVHGADVVVERGIAMFVSPDGSCGIVSAGWLDAVLAERQAMAQVAVRLVRSAHHGDLGVFGYAAERGGLLSEMLAHTSTTLDESERRFADWFRKVVDILRRGVRGSSGIIWLAAGRLEIESVVEYDEVDRAAAHAVVADTTRELIQVTIDALSTQFEGSFPTDFTENLRIERNDRVVTMHWDVSEQSLAEMMRQIMNPSAVEESPLLAGMQDGFAFAQASVTPGPAEERITFLEPRRAELESSAPTDIPARSSLVSLGEAYITRGRWSDARAVFEGMANRATTNDDPDALGVARLGLARLALERGETATARTTVATGLSECDQVSCGPARIELELLAARFAREDGRFGEAESALEAAFAFVVDESTATRMTAERIWLRGARGNVAEARVALADIRRLRDHSPDAHPGQASIVEAEIALALVPRQRTSDEDAQSLRVAILASVPFASDDSVASQARAQLLLCRLERAVPSRGGGESDCDQAISTAATAHGERHPALAEAYVAKAQLAADRRDAAAVAAALTQAESALDGLPDHPLRATIAAMRGRGRAPGRAPR